MKFNLQNFPSEASAKTMKCWMKCFEAELRELREKEAFKNLSFNGKWLIKEILGE